MAVGGPDLELGIAPHLQRDPDVVVGDGDVEVRDDLRVAPIQPFGQSDDRGEHAHDHAPLLGQQLEPAV